MPTLTAADSYKSIISQLPDSLLPVSFLYGEEHFYIDRIQEKLVKSLPEDQRDFNLDLLYGSEISVDKVFTAARSFPMNAERRVVIVREFLSIQQGKGSSLADLLEAYLSQPNPFTLLCFSDATVPDKRTALGKLLTGKRIHSFQFDRLPDYKLPDWIDEWTKVQFGKKIESKAAVYLAELVGNDLTLLSSEIEKVSVFVDTQELITIEHVGKITGHYREKTVIELSNAIFSRNLDAALRISEQLLLTSESGVGEILKTIGLLSSTFSNVWQILRLKEKRLTLTQIQSTLHISNPYYFKRLVESAEVFQLAEMPLVFEALLDADKAAKGFTTLDPDSILPIMIHRILSSSRD